LRSAALAALPEKGLHDAANFEACRRVGGISFAMANQRHAPVPKPGDVVLRMRRIARRGSYSPDGFGPIIAGHAAQVRRRLVVGGCIECRKPISI
jgi:hypothetical protein